MDFLVVKEGTGEESSSRQPKWVFEGQEGVTQVLRCSVSREGGEVLKCTCVNRFILGLAFSCDVWGGGHPGRKDGENERV